MCCRGCLAGAFFSLNKNTYPHQVIRVILKVPSKTGNTYKISLFGGVACGPAGLVSHALGPSAAATFSPKYKIQPGRLEPDRRGSFKIYFQFRFSFVPNPRRLSGEDPAARVDSVEQSNAPWKESSETEALLSKSARIGTKGKQNL